MNNNPASPDSNFREQLVTFEVWRSKMYGLLLDFNHDFYSDRGFIENGTRVDDDSIMQSHFDRHPEFSGLGLSLIVAPSNKAMRQDLMIHVDRNQPNTFDILLTHTSIVPTRMSKLITRPQLREILKYAPANSELALERIDYREIVFLSEVEPSMVMKRLFDELSAGYAFIIFRKALLMD